MSSHSSNFSDETEDQEISTVSELSARVDNLMRLLANYAATERNRDGLDTDSNSAGSENGFHQEGSQNVGPGPQDNILGTADSMGSLEGQTEIATDESRDIETAELRVSELSAKADIAQAIFQITGDVAYINEAIEHRSQVLLLTPDGHSARPGRLHALGISYLLRFKSLGELADVDKAIECQTQAVQLTPNGHADKLSRLGNLGVSHEFRFEYLGQLADLDKAIECQTQVVQLSPDGHADKRGGLVNLGVSYYSRFEHFGELADVDKSIEYLTQAIHFTPDGDEDEDKGRWLSNLGVAYERRFERLGEVADVDKAIKCHTQAVQLTIDGDADKARRLSNLGVSYGSRFERLDEITDADKAIECHIQAVQLTPDGHADKPSWVGNLGTSYHVRFERRAKLSDVDKAIEYHAQAVQLTPEGHAERPGRLSNLGISYRSRFTLLNEVADVDKAIECLSQSVQLTPDDHAHKPDGFNNLGISYRSRFERLGESADLEHARSYFQRAAELNVTQPETQIGSAREWAAASLLLGLSPQLAYQRCMELVPRLIWLGTTIEQRYKFLGTISDLAAEAAAWAISVQANELALEWLEEGRSIVWNQILQLRTPFDDLSSVDPTLAQKLKDTAAKLEGAGSRQVATSWSPDDSLDLEKEAQLHRRLADDWERLLRQARSTPGFHNFMLPRKAHELKLAATDGPVILINTHNTRCDALIVFPRCDEVAHVPLDGYSSAKLGTARELSDLLVGHRGDRGLKIVQRVQKSEKSFRALLSTLWLDVVKPILDSASCLYKNTTDEMLHVTWCTTGALSFLPLHAAGCYDGLQPNASDLVISSYTPTLNALLVSNDPVSHTDPGVLAIGQQHTPGFHSLPNTVQELEAIERLSEVEATRFLRLDDEHATVDAVLDAMDKHNWVHLACHATQNAENPAQSAFYLHDGSLTLETITKRSFKDKGLAFLSACQTATGDMKLSDESVHLAAGMLMSGYRSVIATMWAIQDEDGPEIAQGVYGDLLKNGRSDHRQAAKALHKAVASLREKVGDSAFVRWVPFIHIGV